MTPKVSIVILVSLMLTLLLASGCERSVSPHRGPAIDLMPYIWDLERSPRENREAEVMALCLSNRLVAPEHLYQTILYQLAAIRAQYGDSIPQLKEISFRTDWAIGELLILLTIEARELVRIGKYHDLDFLNEYLKLKKMDTCCGWNHLIFEGCLHPEYLVDLYVPVASVEYAQPNFFYGDGSTIYPSFSENGITYLFREAWGDCPSGCYRQRFWCFEADGFDVNYIGFWDPATEPEPDWWGQARTGIFPY